MKTESLILLFTITCPIMVRADDPLDVGGIALPAGYRHEYLLSEDTFAGRIWKPEGLEIRYSSGGPGGDVWADRYPEKLKWKHETNVSRFIAVVALYTDNKIVVTFLDRDLSLRNIRAGNWNFEATVKSLEDVAEFMAIVMSYPAQRPPPSTTQPMETTNGPTLK